MSWSYRRTRGILVVAALAASANVTAQQTYFVPTVEATAEWNTNREMIPDPAFQDASINYRLNTLALWGWQTQRSQFELRPRVQFQEFPDRQGIDPVEYFLDLRTEHRTLKGEFGLLARYAHQDTYNAEYGQAAFDPFDPKPTSTDGGIVFVGGSRETIEGEGSFRYEFTQLTSMSGLVSYEKISYSNSDFTTQRVGYEYPYAELTLNRALGPVAEFSIGPYAARSEADDGSNQTDSLGAKASVYYKWSETVYFTVAGVYERNDITNFTPTRTEDTVSDWGLEFSGYYQRRIGSVRYAIGRYLTPATFGTRTTKDQIRVQYIRPLSPLWTFNGAVRATLDKRLGDQNNPDRKRAQADLTLTRQLTPSWYISGGYRYAWQDLGGTNAEADNNAVFLTVGYRGLDTRQARTQ